MWLKKENAVLYSNMCIQFNFSFSVILVTLFVQSAEFLTKSRYRNLFTIFKILNGYER